MFLLSLAGAIKAISAYKSDVYLLAQFSQAEKVNDCLGEKKKALPEKKLTPKVGTSHTSEAVLLTGDGFR